ncbi:MAG: TonB family protein, partial [Pseudomonadota bacterium]
GKTALNGFSRRQWLLALAIAVLIHGSITYVVLRSPPDAGSIAAGAGGISVALGPAGRAPGSIETVPPPTAEETADPVDELDEVKPDDPPPKVLEDVEEIQAAEAGEAVEAKALQDVDPETPDEATATELETVTAEPLELEEVTSEETETVELKTTRQVNVPDEVALDAPTDTAEALMSETLPDAQSPEQVESVQPDEVTTAAIIESADPEPIDVPLTPEQDADELAALPSEPPVIHEASEADVSEAVTAPPEQTPSAPEAAVAEVQNAESPEMTDVVPEPLDEPLPERVETAIAEAADVTPEQVTARSPNPEPVAETVIPSPRKPLPPELTNSKPPAEEVTTEPAQLAGAGGEAGDQADGDLGSGESVSGGDVAGARADYQNIIRAWLQQHHVYPRRAQARRQEGVVLIRFVINREGRVIDYEIQQSSGYRLLDRAADNLIERAQPFPPIPNEINGTNMPFTIPLSFVAK